MLSPVLLVSLVTVIPSLSEILEPDSECEDCPTLTRHTVRHWLGAHNNNNVSLN